MFVVKNPEFARKVGLISAKANLLGRSADWPSYLGLLAQMVAAGGLIFFSLMVSWVFGREFADGTLKDLLAVPVSRVTILLAKYIVVALWCVAATVMLTIVSLGLGAVIGLPEGTSGLLCAGNDYPGHHRLSRPLLMCFRSHSSPVLGGGTCCQWEWCFLP